jgi:hypothetical protein
MKRTFFTKRCFLQDAMTRSRLGRHNELARRLILLRPQDASLSRGLWRATTRLWAWPLRPWEVPYV